MYANPSGIRASADLIAQPVDLLPQLAGEAVAPNPGMYGKVLIYSAQQVEPAATEARQFLLGAMHTSGRSIVDSLRVTADDYEATEQAATARVAELQRSIEERWG